METRNFPVMCFAKPLDDDKLTRYEALAAELPDAETKDAYAQCLACVKLWWELPESTRTDVEKTKVVHRGRPTDVVVVPLEKDHVQQLWDVTPWKRDILAMLPLFEALPHGTEPATVTTEDGRVVDAVKVVDPKAYELRNAAFDLAWHAMEITHDREPLTEDKL